MIRSETEYQEAVKRLSEEQTRLADHRARLKETGLTEDEIKRVVDPMESFYLQFKEEVESYERLKRGEFEGARQLARTWPSSDRSSHCSGYLTTRACEAAGGS